MAFLLTNLKNRYVALMGFHTNRHLLAIESDDWGSIRMPSRKIFEKLQAMGDHPEKDAFLSNDSLESPADLGNLFGMLLPIKDANGKPPVFTANFAVANPNFDRIDIGSGHYEYETFLETYKHYYPNVDVFSCIKTGIEQDVFCPQLHCREHMNVKRWMTDLKHGKKDTLTAFENRTIGINASFADDNRFGYMDAFNTNYNTKQELQMILQDAAQIFEKAFGEKSKTFVASCFVWDNALEEILRDLGVTGIQSSYWQNVPSGSAKELSLKTAHESSCAYNNVLKRKLHYSGQRSRNGLYYSIRNCDYEPAYRQNAAEYAEVCLKQVRAAFHEHKPAVINSHRFNYISSINPLNAEKNLEGLSWLLKEIIKEFPDTEFISTPKLVEMMSAKAP